MSRFIRCIRSFALAAMRLGIVLAIVSTSICTADEAAILQQQAIERIDGYVDHFRKTSDSATLLPDLQRADAELAASYDAFMRHGNLEAAALSLIKRGDISRYRANWQLAIDFYQHAYDLAQQAHHLPHQARALSNRAVAERLGLRDYGAAAVHVEEALRLSGKIDDKSYLFDGLDELGSIQSDRGELVAAAATRNRALVVAEVLQDETRLFYGYLGRAGVYLELGRKCDYQKAYESCYEVLQLAKSDYERALVLARKLGYAGLATMTKDFLGDVEIRRQLTKQQETFDKDLLQQGRFHPRIPSDVLALEQFTLARLDLPPGAPEQLMNQLLGAFAQSLNLPSRSSEQMQQWEALGGTLGDARSHYLQGTVLEGQGQDDAALAAFLKAVELLEANRSTLPDEKSRGTFLEDKINFYYKPILHLLDRRRLGDAFELLERSRSRAMADLLASNPPSLRQSKDRDLYAKLRTLEVNIALREQELFIDRAKPDPARLAARIAGNEQEIQRLEAEHRRLLARIAEEAPKLRQLTVSAPMSLEQLQHSMRQEGYEVLQYLALETTIIVWHIRSDAVQVKSVFLPKSELIKKVAKLRNSLDRPERFDEQTARELYLFLIQPVLSGIRGEHLVIIPHEDLYYIPFQVLQDPSDGTYIGERFRISYAPSATILLGLNKAGSLAGEKLLAVADPSIGQAQQEVTAIARMYPGGHKVVSDALVRETDIKAWVADYNVLHLSVHGEFTPQEPLLSHLKLAEGGQDDGKLTAAEMFGLPLEGVRLAVLSACETGQAEATHANEVLGMMRALLYAGANTLILSSWRVDAASTALWMEAFYQEAQTRPVSEAARLALEVVKRHPRYGHPYYWGPFVMIGK